MLLFSSLFYAVVVLVVVVVGGGGCLLFLFFVCLLALFSSTAGPEDSFWMGVVSTRLNAYLLTRTQLLERIRKIAQPATAFFRQ